MMANSIQGNPKKKSKRSMIVILILLLILAALVVLIWTTYSAMLREYQAAREAIANAPVQTAVVERGDLSEAIDDLTGTLRSKQSVSLYWKAAGTVGSVDVALGDKVEKGQVLAELDEGTISSTINEAAVTKEKKEKELGEQGGFELSFQRGNARIVVRHAFRTGDKDKRQCFVAMNV